MCKKILALLLCMALLSALGGTCFAEGCCESCVCESCSAAAPAEDTANYQLKQVVILPQPAQYPFAAVGKRLVPR